MASNDTPQRDSTLADAHAPRAPRAPAPAIATNVLGGFFGALLAGAADLVQCSLRDTAPRVPPLDFAIASLHLLAIYALAGVLLGSVAGIVVALGRARARGARLRGWLGRDPSSIARIGAIGIAALPVLFVVSFGHLYAITSFHRQDLGGYLLGAITIATVAAAAALRRALLGPLRRAAIRAGPLATRAWLLAIAIVIAGVAGGVLVSLEPEILSAYDPRLLAGLVIWALAWWLAAATTSARLAGRAPKRARIAATIAVLLAVAGVAISAHTFGASNRVRSVVEQRSMFGRRAVRVLAAITDTDRDLYSWAFGGGDCDDSDPEVHPGALDLVGDGVDADCFGGDGAPRVIERGRGGFGRPLAHLSRPNFLVVTIEALRRDHLGAHGYERPTSPAIDEFARAAIDFRGVVPQSSRSLRSIPSMWTGNYPSEIAYGAEALWPSVSSENVLASELLAQSGYRTSSIMATNSFARIAGFFQGFDPARELEVPDPPRDRAVNEALPELRRLATSGSPWLLWVHLHNCQAPYLEDGHPSSFGREPIDLYDTEIQLADAQVGRLLSALEELGLAQRTVVVLASDHGEAFGEHGTFGHSTTLYEEELRSMLMIRAPGLRARQVDAPVGLLDVAPTILELAGLSLSEDISGISLLPIATGERDPDPERPLFAELIADGVSPYDIQAIRRGTRKLIWWVGDGTFQLFDLSRDPHEQHDLSDERRDEALAMLGDLRAWSAGARRVGNRSGAAVDPNRREASATVTATRRMEVRFPGMFSVIGVALPRRRFAPGETIPLTTFYRVDDEIDRDLVFSVDFLVPPDTRVPAHFQAWHFPLHARRPTTRWIPGEIVRDPTPIVIPNELEVPVQLRIQLRVRDGDRLLEASSEAGRLDAVELGEIEVVPRTALEREATP